MNTNNAWILHVEDDENDVMLQQYAFERAGLKNPIHVARDGQEAIDFLTPAAVGKGPETNPLPFLVLLDLKLPLKSGFDVLKWIRQQPQLSGLPVIVLTSSHAPTDVLRAYELGANSFILKPIDHGERVRMAEALKNWWLHYNLLPAPFSVSGPEREREPVSVSL